MAGGGQSSIRQPHSLALRRKKAKYTTVQGIFCKTFQVVTAQSTDSRLKYVYSQVYLIFDITSEGMQYKMSF